MVKLKRFIFCVLYYGFAQWLPASYMPGGSLWCAVRRMVCRPLFASCGTNVNIELKAFFHTGRGISIGDRSGIGVRAYLSGTITIGHDVMMGKDVTIMTSNHNFARTDIPMSQQGFQLEEPVMIADDVWIGDRVIILPGVKIGRGVIIGAGAVVAKDVPDWAIVVGNPAKVVRLRR